MGRVSRQAIATAALLLLGACTTTARMEREAVERCRRAAAARLGTSVTLEPHDVGYVDESWTVQATARSRAGRVAVVCALSYDGRWRVEAVELPDHVAGSSSD